MALRDQLPVDRFVRNLFKGHLFGLLHKRSHFRDDGKAKVMYNTKETAKKAAASMMKKQNKYFSTYKCMRCDGYHLGKNRENK